MRKLGTIQTKEKLNDVFTADLGDWVRGGENTMLDEYMRNNQSVA